jgi:hypothetical protein
VLVHQRHAQIGGRDRPEYADCSLSHLRTA